MIKQNDKGGRPPNTRIKHIIPYIIKELGLANVAMVKRRYEIDTGQSISFPTVKKYARILTEEGILRKEIVVDNSSSKKRNYSMIMYSLK